MNLVVTLDSDSLELLTDRCGHAATFLRTLSERYLENFRRGLHVRRPRISIDDIIIVTGRTVHFHAVPYYLGPWNLKVQVREAVRSAMGATDAILCESAPGWPTTLFLCFGERDALTVSK